MLSGCDDVKLAVRAMKGGALDYIVKPFDLKEVGETLGRAIGNKRQVVGRERYLMDLERSLEQKSGELRSTIHQLQEASEETLDALATALDARERETLSHSKRVSEYSAHLARELGLSGARLEEVRQGSMLHDIGKIGIPDRVLLKPGQLTEEEWAVMRKHPEIGAWIVEGVESLRPASSIVIAHHERFDGLGYPRGLRADEIPLGARIFAVADTLDAVLSDRPYRSGQSYEHAREEIGGNAGSQFDPEVTACFLRVPPRVWEEIREYTLAHQHSHLVLT
jgi:putative nucleotidyltransferase with HDIG domain